MKNNVLWNGFSEAQIDSNQNTVALCLRGLWRGCGVFNFQIEFDKEVCECLVVDW